MLLYVLSLNNFTSVSPSCPAIKHVSCSVYSAAVLFHVEVMLVSFMHDAANIPHGLRSASIRVLRFASASACSFPFPVCPLLAFTSENTASATLYFDWPCATFFFVTCCKSYTLPELRLPKLFWPLPSVPGQWPLILFFMICAFLFLKLQIAVLRVSRM